MPQLEPHALYKGSLTSSTLGWERGSLDGASDRWGTAGSRLAPARLDLWIGGYILILLLFWMFLYSYNLNTTVYLIVYLKYSLK